MPKPKSYTRLQSAMEYLMTYGWSILLIAIVIAALYALGVFGNGGLPATAQPNSCRVYRPYGAGSTASLNLQGICNGALPKYVCYLNGAHPWVSNPIAVADSPSLDSPSSAVTLSVWVEPGYTNGFNGIILKTTDFNFLTNGYGFRTQGNYQTMIAWVGNGVGDDAITFSSPQLSTWSNIVMTYSSTGTMYVYVNGVQVGSKNPIGSIAENSISLVMGGYFTKDYFNGSIANVQVYNTALDPASVSALYTEGIGGAPITLQSLVAWWPLNGDTNDYSGNGNSGIASNIIFTSSWSSGYTTP